MLVKSKKLRSKIDRMLREKVKSRLLEFLLP